MKTAKRALRIVIGCAAVIVVGCDSGGLQDAASGRGAPRLVSAKGLSRHYVEVTFSKEVGVEAEDAARYSITSSQEASLPINAAVRGSDPKTIILTTAAQREDAEYLLTLLPNEQGSTTTQTASFPANNSNEPFVMTAISLSNTSVLLTFNLRMEVASSQNATYYAISNPDLGVSAALNTAGGFSVLLTTSPQNETSYLVKVTNIKSTTGVYIDPEFNTGTFEGIGVNDGQAPKLVGAEATSYTTIRLSFSEPVQNFADDTTSYSIEPTNPPPPSLLVYGAVPNDFGTQVLLQIQPLVVGEEYTVTATRVEDRSGNAIGVDNTATFTFTGGITEPGAASDDPRVVGAIPVSNTLVDVHFSKPMGDSAADPEHYRITGSETAFLYVVEAILSTDRTTARLTTSSQGQDFYTVQAAGVKDLEGNPIAAPSSSLLAIVGLDPTKAQFLGIAPSEIDEHTDADGDGFADWFETVGWPIIITSQNGDVNRAFVTSNPYNPDTDADGLTDGEENAYEFDPRTDDTDADRVTDSDEFNLWYSDPADQDSDNDGFDDYLEINFFLTSPILADTDGDGFSDDEEIMERNRSPFIADLPLPQITVDDISLELNITSSFTDEEGVTRSISDTTSSTFTQSRTNTVGKSDTTTTQTEAEFGQELGFEAGVGVGFKVAGQASSGQSLANGFSSTVDTETSETSQQEYQNSVTNALEESERRSVTRNIESAIVQATVNISNKSNLAFSITNLEVSLLQQDRLAGLSFRPIATLRPTGAEDATAQPTFNLAPLEQERGPIIFENVSVFPNRIDALMREPTGLIFDVVNFDVLDENGRNLVFTSQDVEDKTVGITIDFGDGRVESYRVATASQFDDFARMKGISMQRAMEIIGLAKAVSASPDIPNTYSTVVDVRPGTSKVELPTQCTDGLDNDCDELIDCLDPDCKLVVACACGNGTCRAPENRCTCPADCGTPPDSESGVCGDGIDNDCDENSDCLDENCAGATACPCDVASESGLCADSKDNDCDGQRDCADPDCASASGCACVSSSEASNCQDNLDNDCDGLTDCLDPNCSAVTSCTTCGTANTLAEVPVRIRDVANSADGKRFWTSVSSNTDLDPNNHFTLIPLHAHESILLMFTSDQDSDGLFMRHEYLYGSDDTKANSDSDTLGDFEEVRTGWIVQRVPGLPYKTYPSPARPDSDQDGLKDHEERSLLCVGGSKNGGGCTTDANCPGGGVCTALGTDPNRSDTDEDALSDFSEIRDSYDILLFDGDALITNNKVLHVAPYSDWVIVAGSDGDCDTSAVATGSDDALFTSNLSGNWRTCVRSGANGTMETSPASGDSLVAWPRIDAGPDGVCQTTTPKTGSDDLAETTALTDVPLRKTCISAGSNGVVNTDPLGDDFIRTAHLGLFGTNPLRSDTDLDGIPDGRELLLGINPNFDDAGVVTDTDGDGLSDDEEDNGWTIRGSSPAVAVDSDKNRPDTDFDGIPDILERAAGSNPRALDTDGDLLLDVREFDRANDIDIYDPVVLASALQRCDAAPNCQYDEPLEGVLGTDPAKADTDGDTRNDKTELDVGWNVQAYSDVTSEAVKSSPKYADEDNDGLNDAGELTALSHPQEPDTDADARLDGAEIAASRNPLRKDYSLTVTLTTVNVIGDCDSSTCRGLELEGEFNLRKPDATEVTLHTEGCKTEECACETQQCCDDSKCDGEDFVINLGSTFVFQEGETFTVFTSTLKDHEDVDAACNLHTSDTNIGSHSDLVNFALTLTSPFSKDVGSSDDCKVRVNYSYVRND